MNRAELAELDGAGVILFVVEDAQGTKHVAIERFTTGPTVPQELVDGAGIVLDLASDFFSKSLAGLKGDA